jgi:hypothetical protein
MKDLYIPKGKTQHYESLSCENIIVDGALEVDKTLKARHISGKGMVDAGTLSARTARVMSLEASTVVLRTLVAERVCAAEVKVSGEAMVTCYLEAEYVEAKKLTVAGFQVGDLRVQELAVLEKTRESVVTVLVGSWIRRFIAFLDRYISQNVRRTGNSGTETGGDAAKKTAANDSTASVEEPCAPGGSGAGADDELQNDFEFLRLKALYRFLKHQGQGYILRIVPQQDAPKPAGPVSAAPLREAA